MMVDRYRTTFEIVNSLVSVADAACEWALALFDGSPPDAPSGVWRSEQQIIELWRGEFEGETAFELQWTLPDDTGGADARWRIELQLAQPGGADAPVITEAAVHHEGASSVESRGELVRLSLVRELIARFDCSRDGLPLLTRAAIVSVARVDRFLSEVLTSRSRTMPVVVVSRDGEGAMALDADALQRDLAGLAIVAVWDEAVSRHVTAALGRQLACYGGAVRVYRPGLTAGDAPSRHRYTLRSGARSTQFRSALCGYVADLSAEPGHRAPLR